MHYISLVPYLAIVGLTIASCTSARTDSNRPGVASVPTSTELFDAISKPPGTLDTIARESDNTAVFGCVFEQQPQFHGGMPALYRFIEANLKIPAKAKKAAISGRVFVSFNVEETGEITDITVLKGLGFGCDDEAVRLIASMPKWDPGKLNNKPVRARYTLPIVFMSK